jgi:hypothetical protein
MLSQYQYGVPSAFTIQANPQPHVPLTPQQEMNYKMQLSFHGSATDTVRAFLERILYRARYYRFFFFAPLYVALLAFLPSLRQFRFLWAAGTVILLALGVNFFPAFQLHYVAAAASLFLLMSVVGLERLWHFLPDAARVLICLCMAQFIFWYSLHAGFDNTGLGQSLRGYESWDQLPHRGTSRRAYVQQALDEVPGQLLVFVRYYPQHIFQDEWVYNRANIDSARVVWARDLGPQENAALMAYYPGRRVVLLEPDFRPPRMRPYTNTE